MDIRKTFDDEAEIYEQTSRKVNIYFDEALDFFVENLKIEDNAKILDVCCGTGILTEKILKRHPKASVVGVDFSSGMLEIAKKRLKEYNFVGVLGDICDERTFENLGQFDCVVTSFGVHNIHGYEKKMNAIKNISAHLKQGGQYATCDILRGETKEEEEFYRQFQYEWLKKSYDEKEVNDWIKLLAEEDEPETFEKNVKLLNIGKIENVELLWKKQFLGIWKGEKIS